MVILCYKTAIFSREGYNIKTLLILDVISICRGQYKANQQPAFFVSF